MVSCTAEKVKDRTLRLARSGGRRRPRCLRQFSSEGQVLESVGPLLACIWDTCVDSVQKLLKFWFLSNFWTKSKCICLFVDFLVETLRFGGFDQKINKKKNEFLWISTRKLSKNIISTTFRRNQHNWVNFCEKYTNPLIVLENPKI